MGKPIRVPSTRVQLSLKTFLLVCVAVGAWWAIASDLVHSAPEPGPDDPLVPQSFQWTLALVYAGALVWGFLVLFSLAYLAIAYARRID